MVPRRGEFGTTRLFAGTEAICTLAEMWAVFVFVVSSVSCLHLGYEMVRWFALLQICATNGQGR